MNPLRGESPLTIGGETLTLVFDANAFCAIEAMLERDTDKLVEQAIRELAGASINMVLWRGMLWGGLQRHHPCTMEQAGDILGRAGMIPVKAAIILALREAFGLQTVEDGDAPDPRMAGAAGTG